MKSFKLIFFSFSLLFVTALWAESSPVPMLENAANQIINSLKTNKSQLKSNPNLINKVIRQHLLPIVDVQGMSRSVLGRNAWRSATAEDKKQFSKEFTQLVIRTYATPLAQFTDEKIKFMPVRGSTNKRFLRISSMIVRSNGPNIPLNYSLVSKNGQWRVYDITVEGVSLLQSFRSQFAQALQNSNMRSLINELHQHNIKAG